MFCRNCGKEMTDGAAFCVSCGAANNPVNCEANNPVNYAANQMPMKWYNFLIYFALFAGAVLNVLTGIFMLTGAQYNMQGGSGTADLVYMFYSDLKTVDVLFGLLILALAVFNIITRSRLANYKSDALMFLNINNAAAAGVTILYALVASAVINVNVIEAQQVGQISGSIIVIVINTIYFGKRKHLFVN